jgi:lysophospholipase L1-like esterase
MLSSRTSFGAVALLLALAATAADARTARLRRLVVVGDSLLAGFGSGGLVERGRPGQKDSPAAFVARRARVRLPLPAVTKPGVPPPLVIRDQNGNGRLDPGEVRRTKAGAGFRDDTDRRAWNLAVPGEDMRSVFDEISPTSLAGDVVGGGGVQGRDLLKLLILGFPLRAESVSQPSLARELDPTFILVWLGNNDVLPMATETNPSAVTMSHEDFRSGFRRLLGALADTGAEMAVANLPDVTNVAALRHAAGEVTQCRTAAGAIEPVASDDLLSIDLDRALLPVPPCGKVLRSAERARIRATVAGFNDEIAQAIADVERTRGVAIAPVDVFALVDRFLDGIDVNGDGTADVRGGYLGGLFSLDGVQPTRTGYAVLANAFIEAIDARFGESIPTVRLARVARRDPLAHSRFRPAGEPPFGVIDPGSQDVASSFDLLFQRIEDDAADFGSEIEEALSDFFNPF